MSDLYDTNIDSIDGWGVCWWMHLMYSTPLIAFLCCCMPVFCGLDALVSFLTLTVGWSVLVLRSSSDFLYSKEGVTQGDPLSMFMYAVGTLL